MESNCLLFVSFVHSLAEVADTVESLSKFFIFFTSNLGQNCLKDNLVRIYTLHHYRQNLQ